MFLWVFNFSSGGAPNHWVSILALIEHVDGFKDGIANDFEALGA
jgi:hypothetical protein